jgi:hypothetical protein
LKKTVALAAEAAPARRPAAGAIPAAPAETRLRQGARLADLQALAEQNAIAL